MSLEQSVIPERTQTDSSLSLDVSKDNPVEGMNLADFLGTPHSEINHILIDDELDLSEVERENAEDVSIESEAKEIFLKGETLQYLEEYCAHIHQGDKLLIRSMLLSYVGTVCLNNELSINLHISGSTGSGKSHALKTVLRLIPQEKRFDKRFSDKALLYAAQDIREGTIICFDDQSLSETAAEIMKQQTSNANEEFRYITVSNQKAEEIVFPRRCPRWFSKADAEGAGYDEQVRNRELIIYADNSEQQRKNIKILKDKQAASMEKFDGSHGEKVCRSLLGNLEHTNVLIPFGSRIEYCHPDGSNRSYSMLLSLIRSFTILSGSHREQRKNKEGDPFLIATEEDGKQAISLMNEILSLQDSGMRQSLTPAQTKIMNCLMALPSGEYSFKELRQETGLSSSTFSQAVCGRKNKIDDDGLLRLQGVGVVLREGSAREKYIDWNAEIYSSLPTTKDYYILLPEGDK